MSALCPLPGCGRQSQDGGVCDRIVVHRRDISCTAHLERDLCSIPGLIAALQSTMARQSRLGPATEKVGGKGESPVFFGQRAAAELRRLDAELARVAVLVFADADGWATVWSAGRLLAAIPDLRTRGDAAALWKAVETAVWRAERAVDAPTMRTVIPVGPCPEQTGDGPCDGLVRAFIPAEEGKAAHMACDHPEEPHVWSSMQWLRAGKRIRDLADKRARATRLAG